MADPNAPIDLDVCVQQRSSPYRQNFTRMYRIWFLNPAFRSIAVLPIGAAPNGCDVLAAIDITGPMTPTGFEALAARTRESLYTDLEGGASGPALKRLARRLGDRLERGGELYRKVVISRTAPTSPVARPAGPGPAAVEAAVPVAEEEAPQPKAEPVKLAPPTRDEVRFIDSQL